MTDLPEPTEGKILSFTDHLQELRVRIIICLAFFVVAFVISFSFAPRVVSFLMIPLTTLERDETQNLLTLYLKPDGEVSGWKLASPTAENADLQAPAPTAQPLPGKVRRSPGCFISSRQPLGKWTRHSLSYGHAKIGKADQAIGRAGKALLARYAVPL